MIKRWENVKIIDCWIDEYYDKFFHIFFIGIRIC
jgi:hypothetical protein